MTTNLGSKVLETVQGITTICILVLTGLIATGTSYTVGKHNHSGVVVKTIKRHIKNKLHTQIDAENKLNEYMKRKDEKIEAC